MTCHDVLDLLHAYADGELDALNSRDVEAHISACPACAQALAADRAVKTVLANPALAYSAPAALRDRLVAASAPKWNRKPTRSWHSLGLAASLAIVLGLYWLVSGVLIRPNPYEMDLQEALASHLRSLQTDGHLMDVRSTDQHTVKPWFDGRVDFAPPVHDLSDHGFPLLGGRLDYLHSRPVAALVYGRAKHIINLFIWPGETGQTSDQRQGYNLLHWSDGGMSFWAVSDLNPAELGQFAGLFRQASAPPHP